MLLRTGQPGLGWAEAGTALETALFPLPRPLGPPSLPTAVRRPRRPLVRLPEAGHQASFPWAVEKPSRCRYGSPHLSALGSRPVGISGLSRQSRVVSRRKAVFTGNLFLLHLLHLPPSLRPEWYFLTTSASHVNISPTLLLCGISLRCDKRWCHHQKETSGPSCPGYENPLNWHSLLTWLIAFW